MLCCFALLLWAIGLMLMSFLVEGIADDTEQETSPPQQEEGSEDSSEKIDDEDIIEGTSDEFEQREKEGQTILIGNVKINRVDGFLNADKVIIHKDVETGETTKTVAEGHVELREAGIFATCDHAILNHVTDIIELRDNVVVLQEEDRLEADFFTFNRRTGQRTGKGNIKFRVRIKPKKQSPSEQTEEESVDTPDP